MGVYDNNPYLPPLAANRPRMEPPRQIQTPQISIPGSLNYSQIQPVSGFDGARAFANGLAIGSSAIIAESDPNIARVYIVAKDANGQTIVEGYKLILLVVKDWSVWKSRIILYDLIFGARNVSIVMLTILSLLVMNVWKSLRIQIRNSRLDMNHRIIDI